MKPLFHPRPTHIVVDLSILERNLEAIQRWVDPAEILPVVKAEAYGHGAVTVARTLSRIGVAGFGVATVSEGVKLREAEIQEPIVVLGGIASEEVRKGLEANLSLTATSRDLLLAIDKEAASRGRKAKVHLEFDTGMSRLGVPWAEARSFLQAVGASEWTRVEGLYSHFAFSESADLTSAYRQLARFQDITTIAKGCGLNPQWIHLGNSGAVLQIAEARFNLVRPGLALFGYYPSLEVQRTIPLEPALRWVTQVVDIREIKAGDQVSYGGTWTASTPTWIATLPVGYGDGYPLRLSNVGEVLIRGQRYPVVGRVCMDHIMVDVGGDAVEVGEPVVLLGSQGAETLSAEELAAKVGTITYEILTGISSRVPRVYEDPDQVGPTE